MQECKAPHFVSSSLSHSFLLPIRHIVIISWLQQVLDKCLYSINEEKPWHVLQIWFVWQISLTKEPLDVTTQSCLLHSWSRCSGVKHTGMQAVIPKCPNTSTAASTRKLPKKMLEEEIINSFELIYVLAFNTIVCVIRLWNQCEEQMAILYNIIASKQSWQVGRGGGGAERS